MVENIKTLKPGQDMAVGLYNSPDRKARYFAATVSYVFDPEIVEGIVLIDLIEHDTGYLTRVDVHPDLNSNTQGVLSCKDVEVAENLNGRKQGGTEKYKFCDITKLNAGGKNE